MSHDLFAAFGSGESSAGPAQQAPFHGSLQSSEEASIGTAITTPSPGLATFDGDEDDFGDFEDASKTVPSDARSTSHTTLSPRSREIPSSGSRHLPSRHNIEVSPAPSTTASNAKPTYPPPKKAGAVASKTMAQKASARPSKPAPEIGAHPFAGRMDFLFEADDDEYDAGTDEIADIASNPEAAMAYSKRVILEQQAREEAKKQAQWLPKQGVPKQRELVPASKGVAKALKGPQRLREAQAEVLFDAEDETGFEQPDDHADVMTSERYANHAASLPAIDLVALDTSRLGAGLESERTNTPIRPMTEFARTLHHQNMVARNPSPVLTADIIADDDEWDDFEEAAASQPTKSVQHDVMIDDLDQAKSSKTPRTISQAPRSPPTNVPPPSVLLSIFPSLLESSNEALFNTLSKLDATQRQTLLSHPATHQFLRGYLALAGALAHIIAGRKLRWKRDNHLAQSMRIGPSVAGGGKGGMKLTGVDRGEIAKEDREVLDCIRLWKMQVGKLRSAVAGATSSGLPAGEAKMPQVPEVAEQMVIRTLKVDEGGFIASSACAVCGLKREERVMKVDVEVEDSFGEWWADGANSHTVCLDFWVEHREKLRSR